MFDLNLLKSFIVVAEELNFRKAAERLNISQPPLSRQIAQLENLLGADLFVRSSRSVKLTSTGKRFYIDALDLISRAQVAMVTAKQVSRGEIGEVNLGFVPSASIGILPKCVSEFLRRETGINLHIREMMTTEILDGLRSGAIDIGLFRLPETKPEFKINKIWSEEFCVAMRDDHPLANKQKIELLDLDNQNFINFSSERGGALAKIIGGHLSASGISTKNVFSVSQSHSILGLVSEGLGVAIVPKSTSTLNFKNVIFKNCNFKNDLRSDLYISHGYKEPTPATRIAWNNLIDIFTEAKNSFDNV